MKKILLTGIVLGILFSMNGLYASFSGDDAGTSGAQFLKLGAGARATSMGNAFAGVADDSTAIYWNPAGINLIDGKAISVTHNIMYEDIYYDWVSVVKPIEGGKLGVGIQYLSYGSIIGRDDTGLATGNFKPNDLAVSISYGRTFGEILTGINLKYISAKIVDTAVAYAVDIGGMYKLMDNKLSVGVVLQNLGSELKYVNESDPLPLNIKVGGSYAVKDNWIVALDINAPNDNEANVCLGTEYIYKVNEELDIAGRAGYTTENKDTKGLNGITAGLGGVYKGYALDYAFMPFGDLGDTHRISFGIKF